MDVVLALFGSGGSRLCAFGGVGFRPLQSFGGGGGWPLVGCPRHCVVVVIAVVHWVVVGSTDGCPHSLDDF